LKLRASYGSTGNQNILAAAAGNLPSPVQTYTLSANGYGNTAAILRGQIGNTSLKWEVVNQGNVGIDFGVWNNKLRGALMYITRKQKAYINQSHNHSLPVLVGIPSNTGSLYNRGLTLKCIMILLETKTLE
jgi:hypothetical protein